VPTALSASWVKASLGIDQAILIVFPHIPSRAQVIPTKIFSDGVVTHKEVLFWEGTMASVDPGIEVIDLTSSIIVNRRSILTEKCGVVKSPGVPRK
jgi:hypothetical protein